jgi:hypothetical protein
MVFLGKNQILSNILPAETGEYRKTTGNFSVWL